MMPNQAMKEKQEVMATTIEVEAEKILKEEVVTITIVKEEATISNHQAEKEVEIILGLLAMEEEVVIFTTVEPISTASTVESMDTK